MTTLSPKELKDIRDVLLEAKEQSMVKATFICAGGRCSNWGKNWKRHLYDGGENCLRCGMDRQEQWQEDKAVGLVSGPYAPNTGVSTQKARPIKSDKLMYCALGDYGIEAAFDNEKRCKKWILEQQEEYEHDDDYYSIVTHTKAELAAMPEV
jgi:hypothetical protein